MFYKFNKIMPEILIQLSTKHPKLVPVYMLLARLSNTEGACIVSQQAIGKMLRKSTRTVVRYLNKLNDLYYIAIARTGRTNVYIVNYNLIWRDKDYKKNFVKHHISFPANVTLTKEDDPKFFNRINQIIKKYGHKNIDMTKIHQLPTRKEKASYATSKRLVQNNSHPKPKQAELKKHAKASKPKLTKGEMLNLRAKLVQSK